MKADIDAIAATERRPGMPKQPETPPLRATPAGDTAFQHGFGKCSCGTGAIDYLAPNTHCSPAQEVGFRCPILPFWAWPFIVSGAGVSMVYALRDIVRPHDLIPDEENVTNHDTGDDT